MSEDTAERQEVPGAADAVITAARDAANGVGDWLAARGINSGQMRAALAAAQNPALGDQRLVPYGQARAEVLGEVVETRLALLALAATTDAQLIDEGGEGWDEEIQALFDRGVIRLQRDYADEYVTVLTVAGREFVRTALARHFARGDEKPGDLVNRLIDGEPVESVNASAAIHLPTQGAREDGKEKS